MSARDAVPFLQAEGDAVTRPAYPSAEHLDDGIPSE